MLLQKYRIRWRFDWHDRAPKYGMWSLTTKNEVDQAWNKMKPGLKYASVEGKTMDGKIVTLAECPGQDFCFFQFHAVARIGLRLLKRPEGGQVLRPVSRLTEIYGIVMVTREKKVFVFDTGHIFVEDRTSEDKAFNYRAYGK